MKSTHCLYTATYADLKESTDPRDVAELTKWNLHGRRAGQFLQERFFLRRCFNHYLEQDDATPLPDTCRLSHGKPYFLGDPAFYNLTNTGQALLLLLSHDGPVGVDAECLRKRRNLQAVAKKVLGPAEWQYFTSLASTDEENNAAQLDFFLQRWTWRECLLKASGIALAGLSSVVGDDKERDKVTSPLNVSGLMYSYALSDVGLGEGWFTIFPGDNTGDLSTLGYSPHGEGFTFSALDIKARACAQVN